jgi:hypothetical protein
MGALTDYPAYAAAMTAAMDRPFFTSTLVNPVSVPEVLSVQSAFGTPTSAVVCNASTAGCALINPVLPSSLTAQYWLSQVSGIDNLTAIWGMLIDRLSHQGGLSGTVTGAQTTNLPTAALTRYTSGVGVFIGIQIYTTIGATATTLVCSYTNQAGTSGKISQPITFGGSNRQNAGLFFLVPLQDGDTGVQSVQSVTLAASTLTAGAFGVVLFKPLMLLPPINRELMSGFFVEGLNAGKLIEVVPNACLSMIGRWNSGNAQPAALKLLEA